MIGIYSIKNIVNKKIYVGQSSDIKVRWMKHKSALRGNIHENTHLQNAWNKYGEENFEFSVIEECQLEELDKKEIYWIQKLDSFNNGYNLDLGGKGCRGYRHSEETLSKMRQVQNPKRVVQLDLDMNYLTSWDSASQAAKRLGFGRQSIISCCEKDRYRKAYGYRWVYEDDYNSGNIDYNYYLGENQKGKRVSQYDLSMNLIKIWSSAAEVARELNLEQTQINAACSNTNNHRNTYHGYVWRYTDYYSEDKKEQDLNSNYTDPKAYCKKKVAQYTLTGEQVAVHQSLSDAARAVGLKSIRSIRACCLGNYLTAGGYKWEYA